MVTKVLSSLLATVALSACVGTGDEASFSADPASEGEISSTSSAVVDSWIGPFSEEDGMNAGGCGTANVAVTRALCTGKYCDNISLYCEKVPAGTSLAPGFGTPWISEESDEWGDRNVAYCEAPGTGTINGIMNGILIEGQYADDIALHCGRVKTGTLTNCSWTGWTSEEDGVLDFGNGRFAAGVACRGKYCDQMRYYTCDLTP
jgi:hypothetical protein